jgi:thioredoxin-related protein
VFPYSKKRFTVLSAILLAALLAIPFQAFASAEASGKQETRDPREHFFIQTFGDLPEEMRTAQESGKLGMLLFFESEGCPYCAYMLREIFSQPAVQDFYREHFVSVAIDIHGDVELTDFDGITLPSKIFSDHRRIFLTPAIAFINLRGEEIFRHTGTIRTPETFLLLGQYIADGHYDDVEFRVYAEQHGARFERGATTPVSATDHSKDQREESP